MKIYTKTGDKGTTSIVGGTRMAKDAPRIEAYGTIDELNSHLGLLAAHPDTPATQRQLLIKIQNSLFNIGGFLAGMPDPSIAPADIKTLEDSIDELDRMLPPLNNFILPGGSTLAANAHIARTICRRAERRIITLSATLTIPEQLLAYINRLSDWLYTFARYANILAEIPENFWQKPL